MFSTQRPPPHLTLVKEINQHDLRAASVPRTDPHELLCPHSSPRRWALPEAGPFYA